MWLNICDHAVSLLGERKQGARGSDRSMLINHNKKSIQNVWNVQSRASILRVYLEIGKCRKKDLHK